MPVTKNIFIFGDSITYGEWDQSGGWANRVRHHYDALVLPVPDDYIITYNLGIPSDTSTGLAHRLTQETRARLAPNPAVKTIQFIIAIGANDSRWLAAGNCRGVELNKFNDNLQKISAAAKAFSSDITFIGLLPCIEDMVLQSANKHQWDETYDNHFLKQYNDAIKQHCLDNDHMFIDVFSQFIDHEYETLLCDGLHPNSRGHSFLFEYIIEQLTKHSQA